MLPEDGGDRVEGDGSSLNNTYNQIKIVDQSDLIIGLHVRTKKCVVMLDNAAVLVVSCELLHNVSEAHTVWILS